MGLWGVLESQRATKPGWKKKKKKKKQNTGLNATPSGEVAQTLASTTNEQGLDSVEDRPTKRPGKIIKQSC